MKSSLIELDMDLSLDIEGQKWNQGDIIRGCLLLKNKSKNTIDPRVFKLIFIYADIKKFKNVSDSSYKEFLSLELKEQKLVPNEEVKIPWEIKLDLNAPVACKKYAPYVLWGNLEKKTPASLMINISPHVTIEKIIELWQNFFRFSLKEYFSSKDGWLEIKFNPPIAKEYATLEGLNLKFKRIDNKLLIDARSTLKLLRADTTGMKVEKKENMFTAEWREKDYLLLPTSVNQDFVCSQIKIIIERLMTKN